MRNKIGSEWTVFKLITIILLLAVLALVLFGIGPKGLIPLKDRLGGMMDNVLMLFGAGNKTAESECVVD